MNEFTDEHAHRLLNVAKACEETPYSEMFDMNRYAHCRGTPACALGNYAARVDLQSNFRFTESYGEFKLVDNVSTFDGLFVMVSNTSICAHFGITNDEEMCLFEVRGCGDAQTPQEAADYIRKFVKAKLQARDAQL